MSTGKGPVTVTIRRAVENDADRTRGWRSVVTHPDPNAWRGVATWVGIVRPERDDAVRDAARHAADLRSRGWVDVRRGSDDP